ncbi:Phage integrase family protein [Thermodesulforhabdus norvegica]|uniref:Phage integrase family protein n=1 Tax=Thermodesulforhabdus norvegica TaxID=39841 RepID=A0A1I4UIA3_9BACT|nr:Phage integrase family protein [Thermodesulforhabdus norvegica]
MSAGKVQVLLEAFEPDYKLIVKLLCGNGLCLMELLRLRIKDIYSDVGLTTVLNGKVDKDQTALLLQSLCKELHVHTEKVSKRHKTGLADSCK